MPSRRDFNQIPVLDLQLADDISTKPQLLAQLRHALIHVGFLYVVNHGVPQTAISDIVNALPDLFSLPPEAKEEVALSNSPHFLGYSGDGTETTAGKADRREQFEFATELDAKWSTAEPLYERLRGPNQWPSAYPSLRPIVETYISEMTLLGQRFLRLIAEALSLPSPEPLFAFLSDQHRLKLVRYPPSTLEPGSLVQGVGPHKDSSGWWTFLLQASSPHVRGLQVLSGNGSWIDAPVVPGSFVVNIGQAFEVVTGGVCKATTHRVVLAPDSPERFSIPFFQGVKRSLTKQEAVGTLEDHFKRLHDKDPSGTQGAISIDSPFLEGKYDTWGESQLRTKIRSHRDVGKKFYGHVFDKYVNE
ncbi:2OG-Fe(II) oxygenase [Lasiosphaeria hispida]|uniref:2OG-Fe(II) oxygenase n=1 Tax=Lasiosphaeria hispida TaxID=260671 RepID=A0AAJ0HPE0_9PEZI|nr:2OG-Fe(II) oxygenase [Lasiosphaeria hispida]